MPGSMRCSGKVDAQVMHPSFDAEVDALGLLCPLPILRASAAMRPLPSGAVLMVLADDADICRDLPAWCEGNGHHLLALEPFERGGAGRTAWRALIRRA